MEQVGKSLRGHPEAGLPGRTTAFGRKLLTAARWTRPRHLVRWMFVTSSLPILTLPLLNLFFKNVPETRAWSQTGISVTAESIILAP